MVSEAIRLLVSHRPLRQIVIVVGGDVWLGGNRVLRRLRHVVSRSNVLADRVREAV